MKRKTSQVWTEYVSVHNAQNNFKEETELTANKNNFVIAGLVLAAFPLYFNEKKEEVENDIRNTMNLKCRETKRKLLKQMQGQQKSRAETWRDALGKGRKINTECSVSSWDRNNLHFLSLSADCVQHIKNFVLIFMSGSFFQSDKPGSFYIRERENNKNSDKECFRIKAEVSQPRWRTKACGQKVTHKLKNFPAT